jgi:hypothetical protein
LAIPPLPTSISHEEQAPRTALAAARAERPGSGGTSSTTTVAWIVAVVIGLGVFGAVVRLDKRLTRR